jgi:hypothetical protein
VDVGLAELSDDKNLFCDLFGSVVEQEVGRGGEESNLGSQSQNSNSIDCDRE